MMGSLRRKSLALFFFCSVPALAAAAAPEESPTPAPEPIELADLTLDHSGGITLTLEKSIDLAIRGAALVLKSTNDVAQSGARLLQSYGQFLPNFQAQGDYLYNTGRTYYTTGTPTLVNGSGTSAGFTLSTDLNVFNGLSDYAALRSAIYKKDAAELTLYRAKQQIALDIAQSFLQVVLDDKLVDIARKNLQRSRERERLLNEQTKLGARNLSDLFRQQAQTSADESLLLTSENKTRTDQILFLRKLRADVAKKYHFAEPAFVEEPKKSEPNSPVLKGEAELINVALSNRTDLKASDNVAEAAQWDIQVPRSIYLPHLDVVGSIASGAHDLTSQLVNGANVVPPTQESLSYQLGTQIDYTVGLQLTWSLFDRFVTHENVERARVAADDFKIDAQDRRNEVEGDVRQAYGDYQTSVQQLAASKKGMVAAEKAYEVMDGRYEVGAASFLDLLTAQETLVQAESARAQALIDFLLQEKSLELAIGTLKVQ